MQPTIRVIEAGVSPDELWKYLEKHNRSITDFRKAVLHLSEPAGNGGNDDDGKDDKKKDDDKGKDDDKTSKKPPIGGYYQTWSTSCPSWDPKTGYCDLANVSPFINQVFISFADPKRTTFNENNANCLGTLFPTTDPGFLKRSVQKLREKNPDVKVFLSVGGATFKFPSRMSSTQIQSIIKYVEFYGLDGIDLDYENKPGCTLQGTKPSC